MLFKYYNIILYYIEIYVDIDNNNITYIFLYTYT